MIEQNGKTIENGSVYFFYRQFLDEEAGECADDIQRFFMVLNPAFQRQYRVMMLGKRKPRRRRRPECPNMWGVVRKIAATPEQIETEIDAKSYHTKTRRERQIKSPRPVGHGLYRIVSGQDDTHLVYSLDVPSKPSEFVPKNFEIAPEADYLLKVKNPDKPFPPGFGIEAQQVQYPRQLQTSFGNRHFSKADPTELLNYEGAGVLLAPAEAAAPEVDYSQITFGQDDLTPQEFIVVLRHEKMHACPEPLFAGSRI